MNLDKYTDKAREAVLQAQQRATEYGQAQIEPEDIGVILHDALDLAPEVRRLMRAACAAQPFHVGERITDGFGGEGFCGAAIFGSAFTGGLAEDDQFQQ